MTKEFVRVAADVTCTWEGLSPIYRIYVNDELFTERTWSYNDGVYLEENLQISAEPGDYCLKFELVPPALAEIHVNNIRVAHGSAQIVDGNILRI